MCKPLWAQASHLLQHFEAIDFDEVEAMDIENVRMRKMFSRLLSMFLGFLGMFILEKLFTPIYSDVLWIN